MGWSLLSWDSARVRARVFFSLAAGGGGLTRGAGGAGRCAPGAGISDSGILGFWCRVLGARRCRAAGFSRDPGGARPRRRRSRPRDSAARFPDPENPRIRHRPPRRPGPSAGSGRALCARCRNLGIWDSRILVFGFSARGVAARPDSREKPPRDPGSGEAAPEIPPRDSQNPRIPESGTGRREAAGTLRDSQNPRIPESGTRPPPAAGPMLRFCSFACVKRERASVGVFPWAPWKALLENTEGDALQWRASLLRAVQA